MSASPGRKVATRVVAGDPGGVGVRRTLRRQAGVLPPMARRSSRGRTPRRLPAVPAPPPRSGSPPSAGHLVAWTRLPRPARPRQAPDPAAAGGDHVLLALGLRPVNLGVAERLFGLQ